MTNPSVVKCRGSLVTCANDLTNYPFPPPFTTPSSPLPLYHFLFLCLFQVHQLLHKYNGEWKEHAAWLARRELTHLLDTEERRLEALEFDKEEKRNEAYEKTGVRPETNGEVSFRTPDVPLGVDLI